MDHDEKIAKLVDQLARRICMKAYGDGNPDTQGPAIGAERDRVIKMLDDTIEELIQDDSFDEWFAPAEVVEIPEEEEPKEGILRSPHRLSRPR
jgi:hypothetical protein